MALRRSATPAGKSSGKSPPGPPRKPPRKKAPARSPGSRSTAHAAARAPVRRAVGSPDARSQNKPAGRTRLVTDERRAQLIALGLELFSSRAYDEVHIAELAAAAGISKGLLYHYFPTKRDFYSAALRVAAEQLLAQLQPDPLQLPLVRLETGLHRYLSYVKHYGTSYVALLRGGIGADPEVAAIIEETRVACMSRLVSGIGLTPAQLPAPLRIALRAWIGTVEAASLEWVLCPEVSAEQVVRMLVEMLLHIGSAQGLLPPR
jgi:AcrR family transcriptional regulator